MKYLNIEDDNINYKISKWLLEELLAKGCNEFSYEEAESACVESLPYQLKLKSALCTWLLGVKRVETVFFNQGSDNWHKFSELYTFNRNTVPVIEKFMGNNLLDRDIHLNKGVANWHFYKDGILLAGASVDDDFITINEPGKLLIDKLRQMDFEFNLKNT
ncbi:hypothetical protein Q4519_20385 [Motilimonas sp. 1_MG-2023]|uniref:hypothetical protein n=1 Tax=Motilimonas sp. 1_MG-2023 TaxID=3062672 RepID=UPI0026E213D5|nr:hypothetical protein [Motilimonas sp. 1_MG-2023]MDO6528037.1 hypothetical protein [Motilimonas sp. 1_MG-2023]